MHYLYGDGSEFPLRLNFLQTVNAATDACVALLEVDEAQKRVRRALEDENAAAIAELAELGALRGALDRTLGRLVHARPSVHRVAGELRELTFGHVERSRAEIRHRREELHRKASLAYDPAPVLAALERFLVDHELPNTSWALSWWAGVGGYPCQALAYALMPRGLAATLEVQIPANHLWSGPVRVDHFGRKLAVRLERRGWFGRARLRTENLDSYYITRVMRTPTRDALLLSKDASKPSPGILVLYRDGENTQLRIVRVDEQEVPTGEPMVLAGLDKVMLQELWLQVDQSIADLVQHRRRIRMATLNGKAATDFDRPLTLVRALVSAVTPWVRNIRRRSRARGQLTLLQDAGDGHTHEYFLSFYELIRKYRHLSPAHRRMFDSYGLADEPAAAPQTRDWRPRPTAAAAQDVPPPRESGTRSRSAAPEPRVSAVRPAARRSRKPTEPLIPPHRLPLPASPPRRGAHAASYGLPETIPPPPADSYAPPQPPATEPRYAPATMVPPPLPRVAVGGAYDLPPINPPPPMRPRLATEPTRPGLRLVHSSS